MSTFMPRYDMIEKPTKYERPRIGERVRYGDGYEEFEGEVFCVYGDYPEKPHIEVKCIDETKMGQGYAVTAVSPMFWSFIEKDPVAVFLEDTWKHVQQVKDEVQRFTTMLCESASVHDASKFGPEESKAFIETAPKLKELEYGSEEYKASLAAIQPAIQHHYAHNDHHPEHFAGGINDMNLIQLVEMFCDWRAAVLRMKDGGDMMKSIDVNEKRFSMSPQLASIFRNTEKALRTTGQERRSKGTMPGKIT